MLSKRKAKVYLVVVGLLVFLGLWGFWGPMKLKLSMHTNNPHSWMVNQNQLMGTWKAMDSKESNAISLDQSGRALIFFPGDDIKKPSEGLEIHWEMVQENVLQFSGIHKQENWRDNGYVWLSPDGKYLWLSVTICGPKGGQLYQRIP